MHLTSAFIKKIVNNQLDFEWKLLLFFIYIHIFFCSKLNKRISEVAKSALNAVGDFPFRIFKLLQGLYLYIHMSLQMAQSPPSKCSIDSPSLQVEHLYTPENVTRNMADRLSKNLTKSVKTLSDNSKIFSRI